MFFFCWLATLFLKHPALGMFVLVSCHLIVSPVSSAGSYLTLPLSQFSLDHRLHVESRETDVLAHFQFFSIKEQLCGKKVLIYECQGWNVDLNTVDSQKREPLWETQKGGLSYRAMRTNERFNPGEGQSRNFHMQRPGMVSSHLGV